MSVGRNMQVQKQKSVKTEKKGSITKPSVISLFSCAMGMDLGFEKAGFDIKYANDIEKFACDTIKQNRRDIYCEHGDITEIPTSEILRNAGIKKVDVIIGGPPCQSFSTAGARKGLEDKRGMALLEFIRVIEQTRPKVFVFENVAGLKSAPLKHMSFYERIKKKEHEIGEEYKLGSLFNYLLEKFAINGYTIDWRFVNAADFGVAQKRKRLILIGSRVVDPKLIFDDLFKEAKWADPKKAEVLGKLPWKTLGKELQNLKDAEKEYSPFPNWGQFLKHVPPGGCWINLPPELQKEAMGGAYDSEDEDKKGKQGGRRGFFRRLSWDAPSPTLVTSPSQMGTCLCHPDEDRPLTVREYARIQGFPDNWKFAGSTSQRYRMIGEAVPVGLAKAIAKAVATHLS